MFAESLQKAQDQIRDLEKENGRLEDDQARLQGLLHTEKRLRADAEKARDGLAKRYESLQTRFATASAQGRSSASRVNALLQEEGELGDLRGQVAALKADLAEASGEAFAAKAQALAASRLRDAETAKVGRLTLELDESEAKLVRAEQAGRQAKDKLREAEQIGTEQAERLAAADRMNEAFVVSMTRGD